MNSELVRKEVISMINNSAIGDDWDDVRKDLFTPEEIAEADLRVAVISALIEVRDEHGIRRIF